MYKVIKEYCGIKEGVEINSSNMAVIKHMVGSGHWEKIEPIKAKVESMKRKKKIEPMKRKKK